MAARSPLNERGAHTTQQGRSTERDAEQAALLSTRLAV